MFRGIGGWFASNNVAPICVRPLGVVEAPVQEAKLARLGLHKLLEGETPASGRKKNFNRNSFVRTSVADLVCLSRIQKFSIPDPIFFSSQIPDPESCIHIMKCILNKQKLFLSSRKHDPGCSSLIRIMDPDPDFYTSQSRIQRHWIPDPQHWIIIRIRDKHSRIPNTSNKETINNNPWVLKLSELRA
jgi:hypothetical protein